MERKELNLESMLRGVSGGRLLSLDCLGCLAVSSDGREGESVEVRLSDDSEPVGS